MILNDGNFNPIPIGWVKAYLRISFVPVFSEDGLFADYVSVEYES